jgi:hypothetical protein
MAESKIPLKSQGPVVGFDAEWLIKQVHRTATYDLGAERVRLDRGSWGCGHELRYYEVGYGPLKTVTVTSNKGSVLRFTAETWPGRDAVLDRVNEFLTAVRKGER